MKGTSSILVKLVRNWEETGLFQLFTIFANMWLLEITNAMYRSESKICMSKLHQRALAVGGICWTYTKDRWLKQKCTFIEGRRHMWTVIVSSRLGHRNFLSWKKGHKGPIGQRHFQRPVYRKKPLFCKTVKNLHRKIKLM